MKDNGEKSGNSRTRMIVGAVYNTSKEKAKRTDMVNDKTSEMVKKK